MANSSQIQRPDFRSCELLGLAGGAVLLAAVGDQVLTHPSQGFFLAVGAFVTTGPYRVTTCLRQDSGAGAGSNLHSLTPDGLF